MPRCTIGVRIPRGVTDEVGAAWWTTNFGDIAIPFTVSNAILMALSPLHSLQLQHRLQTTCLLLLVGCFHALDVLLQGSPPLHRTPWTL